MSETDSPAPPWECTGILGDLLAPILKRDANGCVVDGAHVYWMILTNAPIVNEGRYADTSIDWAEALLAEHLSEDDTFVHMLSGPTSTFTASLAELSGNPHLDEPVVDITVTWSTPRRIELTRRANVILTTGPTGSGKSTTLYALIAALNNQQTP